ncbi:Low-density lipoprotein receptor domain class A [Teladorsagia circumcincta]|uniref:Low-density lipoprotein receptor domain class A n=1 Tax=Teladorsagia circumcincta TaxID=45464 RepID=A0A2G9UNF5_TELCI|nr:Low-density lipoprotein receptor domain class A [Teladorsagia circumcincta]
MALLLVHQRNNAYRTAGDVTVELTVLIGQMRRIAAHSDGILSLIVSTERSPRHHLYYSEPRDCDADHFQCLTGQCIPLQWGCRVGREFRCDPSSACLDMSLKCDGVVDCENGFDEKDCVNISSTRFCRKINEYLCRREQRCIRRSAVCDGIEDCVDGQDEQKCHGKKCALGLFTCRNGEQCIAGHLECDAFNAKIVEARCQAPDITCRTFTGIIHLPCGGFATTIFAVQRPPHTDVLAVRFAARDTAAATARERGVVRLPLPCERHDIDFLG